MKALIIADSPYLSTGLARVGREMAVRFHRDGFKVYYAGWHHLGGTRSFPYEIFPLVKGAPDEGHRVDTIIKGFRPDVILCIGDTWYFPHLRQVTEMYRRVLNNACLTIGYLTVDGEPIPEYYRDQIDAFDVLCSPSIFGCREIVKVTGRKQVFHVPYGVDTNIFRLTTQRLELEGHPLSDKFLYLVNSQNSQRKNLPAVLEAFAELYKKRPDCRLLLATDYKDPAGFPDLELKIKFYGIGSGVVHYSNRPVPMPESLLNTTYNTAQALVVPSMGEGFCLPILEAFATRTQVIGTNYTAMPELLCDGRGVLVDIAGKIWGGSGLRLALIDIGKLYEAMDSVYTTWGSPETEEMLDKAERFAHNLTWDDCFKRIRGFLSCTRLNEDFSFNVA